MKHYLITRFNLKNDNWHPSDNAFDVLSNHWLDNRFEIFESYCFPSIKNQSCKTFTWLVCFDINTPKAYHQKIEDFKTQLPYFEPLFIDGFKYLETELSNYIKKESHQEDKFIITTRLDNDDIVHKDFIKTIQSLYTPHKAVINLDLGYQMITLSKQFELRLVKKKFNPFLSVISDLDHFESVLSQEHHYWRSHPNQIINKKDRLWIQFVHGENVLNKINKASRKTSAFDASAFGLQNIIIKAGKFEVILYNIAMLPYRLYYYLKNKIKHIFKTK